MRSLQILKSLVKIADKVNEEYFHDREKTTVWMNTSNPMLGNFSPHELIFRGKYERVLQFIETALEENKL